MKAQLRKVIPAMLALFTLNAPAVTRYVDLNSPTPRPPYTNWPTAATNIQDAIDAAAAGDEIVATNGVYAHGGRAVYGTMTNRVAINKPLLVRSVNGPSVTFITGQPSPGTTNNGEGAIRCAYVGTNAVLSGFTLTNGHTRILDWGSEDNEGGGAWSEASGVVSNCTLTGNSANYDGGGAYSGTLYNCILTGNSAMYGGGASSGTLNNCNLASNSAGESGGGTASCTLNNCTLTGNSAGLYGGGAHWGTLNNCTLTGNSARERGGGTYSGTLNNCVVNYNTAADGPNYFGSTFSYSCTTPLPSGAGNIDDDPLLASTTHLSAQSPCIGRGSPTYASGVDIDGEIWLNPPCMGADQFIAGAASEPMTVAIVAAYTNVATGFAVSFVDQINGRLTASAWDFGDGVVVSNRVYVSHAWAAPGLYEVCLTGYNDIFSNGINATLLVRVAAQEVYYVNGANLAPAFPYTNWAGAATNIQQAIDASGQIGRLVRVTNGIYASGGRAVVGTMTNRVVVAEGVEVRSEKGPSVTFIVGQPAPGTTNNGNGAVRCAYMGTNAVLSGFTLTNGHTRTIWNGEERHGGGAWCEVSAVVTNCTLIRNSAGGYGGGAAGGTLKNCTMTANSARSGGGAYAAKLNNCTLSSNLVTFDGGGVFLATLNDCTLTGNSANFYGGAAGGGANSCTLNNCNLNSNSANYYGGGAYDATLNNCILAGNSATYSGGGANTCTLNNCILSNSVSDYGGGASGGTLNNCTLTDNWARWNGGGVSGGTLNNCTLTGNSADSGGGASGGRLNKCTLTGNSAGRYGGGASDATLNNCTLNSNSAWNGGGVSWATLNNCILTGNSASDGGGASLLSTLNNCTLTGNSATNFGGGARYSTLNNCIVYYNTAPTAANFFQEPTLGICNYSCTSPQPTNGIGNFTNAPLFVNTTNDFHLQPASPCINAGNNAYVTNSTDLDGNPCIAGGRVDVGAYEFQTPSSILSYAWAQQNGLPTDGSADFTDNDGDGHNNWQEWRADTHPTNALSALRMITTSNAATGMNVTWQSVSTRSYFLERATNFGDVPPFQAIATNIAGVSGTKTYTDLSATNGGPYFYRVGVQ